VQSASSSASFSATTALSTSSCQRHPTSAKEHIPSPPQRNHRCAVWALTKEGRSASLDRGKEHRHHAAKDAPEHTRPQCIPSIHDA
jgi:hypothetical protein